MCVQESHRVRSSEKDQVTEVSIAAGATERSRAGTAGERGTKAMGRWEGGDKGR